MKKRVKVRLAKAEAAYRGAVKKLAEEVRRKVVLPACRKHGYTFDADRGDYNYYFSKGGIVGGYQHELRSVYDVLDACLMNNTPLGCALRDVTAKDLLSAQTKVTAEERASRRAMTAAKRAVKKAAKRAAKVVAK